MSKKTEIVIGVIIIVLAGLMAYTALSKINKPQPPIKQTK